jgi:hypothetical protein
MPVKDDGTATSQVVEIGNEGTGVIAWGATTTTPWLSLSPPAGVAIANDVYCAVGECERDGLLTLTVNPSAMGSGNQRATIRIYSPQTGESKTITVTTGAPGKIGVPGIIKN